MIVPTGAYDPAKDINQSSNFVSFNPYWAFTVLPLSGLEVSARLYYLYNFTNNRPAGIPPAAAGMPTALSAQAGQAAWVNFAASYEILPSLHLGVNGYYFQQFTKDKFHYSDGSEDSGGRADTGNASFLGIGPGVFWDVDKENKLFVNLYFQALAKNVPQSNVVNLHYIHSF